MKLNAFRHHFNVNSRSCNSPASSIKSKFKYFYCSKISSSISSVNCCKLLRSQSSEQPPEVSNCKLIPIQRHLSFKRKTHLVHNINCNSGILKRNENFLKECRSTVSIFLRVYTTALSSHSVRVRFLCKCQERECSLVNVQCIGWMENEMVRDFLIENYAHGVGIK